MPFIPVGLGMAAQNTALQFGVFVAIAVLWQRIICTITVAPLSASLVLALITLVAATLADLRTKREMVERILRAHAAPN